MARRSSLCSHERKPYSNLYLPHVSHESAVKPLSAGVDLQAEFLVSARLNVDLPTPA